MAVVAGELTDRGVAFERREVIGRPCLIARAGGGPIKVILHAHVDVVPGRPDQFHPRLDGGRLVGRGAYDMKAALAVMIGLMGTLGPDLGCEVELVVVPDEERADPSINCTEVLAKDGMRADLVICGEPTDLCVGVQSKGLLLLQATMRGVAAHGSTPWAGRNAILDGVDAVRSLVDLPFMEATSARYDRPSVNLGRIAGGSAVNSVADTCVLELDVRILPGQCPEAVVAEIRGAADWEIDVRLDWPPADVDPDHPLVAHVLTAARAVSSSATAVGRDGTSDAVAFQAHGVPAIEFGPLGGGHHGPDEYVDVDGLLAYRHALGDALARVGAHATSSAVRG